MSSQKRRDSLPNWWSTKTSPKIPLFLTAKGWSNFIWNPNMFTKFYSIQDVSKSCHLRDGSIQIHIYIYIYATFFTTFQSIHPKRGRSFIQRKKKLQKIHKANTMADGPKQHQIMTFWSFQETGSGNSSLQPIDLENDWTMMFDTITAAVGLKVLFCAEVL